MSQKTPKPSKNATGAKPSAPASVELPPLMAQLEEEFSRGNFAAVRAMAPGAANLEAPWPTRAAALVHMTRTDPHAWLVGAGALLVVLLVAALTLHAG